MSILQSRRSKANLGLNIVANLNMIRLEVRCPPSPQHASRSGAAVLDLHGMKLFAGMQLERKPMTRFTNVDPPSSSPVFDTQESLGRHPLLAVECQRLVIAMSPLGQQRANIIMSLGLLSTAGEVIQDIGAVGASASAPVTLPVTSSSPPLRIRISRSELANPNTIAVTIDISSVHADISKPLLDGLQLWADDITQLVERTLNAPTGDTDTEKAESRNPSLIGSRFFAKTRRYGSKSSEESSVGGSVADRTEVGNEIVVKIGLSEGLMVQLVQKSLIQNFPPFRIVFVRLELPREQEKSLSVRPFDIFASNVDILTELRPEGKVGSTLYLALLYVPTSSRAGRDRNYSRDYGSQYQRFCFWTPNLISLPNRSA